MGFNILSDPMKTVTADVGFLRIMKRVYDNSKSFEKIGFRLD